MKSKAHVNGGDPENQTEIFETSRGYQVRIVGLSPMYLEAIRESMLADPDWPDPALRHPTYEAHTVSGDVELHKHDQESIDDPLTPPEHKTLWTAFKAYELAWGGELSDRIMNGCMLEGIKLIDVDVSADSWAARQKRVGIRIPDDPIDRELHFLKTVVIGNVEDLGHIMERIMTRTGLDRNTLAEARSMFPGEVDAQPEGALEGDSA